MMTILTRRTIQSPSLWILFLCLLTAPVLPQNRLLEKVKKEIRFTGQAGTYGELYNVDGIESRRPDALGRIYFRPHLDIMGVVSVRGEFVLSTEGNLARQDINQYGLHPRWKWGQAHLGDFSQRWSRTTFSGVNVKGAGLELFPGRFRMAAAGGQTRRAVQGNVVHESYAQNLFAGRLGWGRQESSFFDIIAVKVKDDPGSLTKTDYDPDQYVIPDTLETELDTLWIEPPYNPLAVTPQENLVLGFNSRLQLADKRLILEVEGSGSAYTKDLNAAEVTLDSLEADGLARALFRELFTPRAGSSYDFALGARMNLNLKSVRLNAGFRHIGPGYVSLGIPSTVNDRREVNTGVSFRAGSHRIRLGWTRLSDNLSGQKRQTNTRNQFQTSVASLGKRWRSQISLRGLLMDSDAAADSLAWTYDNWVLSTHQSLVFGATSVLRQLGLQYTFQTSDKRTQVNPAKSRYHTLSLTAALRLVQRMSLNTSAGLTHRDTQGQKAATTQVYSLRLSHSAAKNRLSSALFASSSMVRDTRMLRAGITSAYRTASNYQITLNLSYNRFRGARDYRELRSSLMVSHQF